MTVSGGRFLSILILGGFWGDCWLASPGALRDGKSVSLAGRLFLGKFFTPDTFALCASVSGAMSKSMSCRTSAGRGILRMSPGGVDVNQPLRGWEMWGWLTPGIARPCGRSLTLGFRKHSLFEASAVLGPGGRSLTLGFRRHSLFEAALGRAGVLAGFAVCGVVVSCLRSIWGG